jgi:hypothetical protein
MTIRLILHSMEHDSSSSSDDSPSSSDMSQHLPTDMDAAAVDEIMTRYAKNLWDCYGTFVRDRGESWWEHLVDFKHDSEKFYDHVLRTDGSDPEDSDLVAHLAGLDDWSRLALYVASTMKFCRNGGQAKSPTTTISPDNEALDK